MKLSDFDYKLPENLIAQTPLKKRDSSKLLVLNKNSGKIEDKNFNDISNFLWDNDVLVLNETRVINARLKWTRESWKDCEIFLHKQINQNTWDCLVYPWKKLKIWKKIIFSPIKENWLKNKIPLTGIIKSVSTYWKIVEFNMSWIELLTQVDKLGQIPLPPYIKENLVDNERYQTVFNKTSGSVAAPTAWLHFTPELLKKLESSGVKIEKVLLHVGLWTFVWVETENIKDHKMHSEFIEIKEDVSKRLNKYKMQWKRIISVWTTSNRVLESFSDNTWKLWHGNKETSIFIYPWYKWKFVDSLITNFHLPKSTLLMLVSSLGWKENIKKAYEHAISHKYRFFSFWDAMWIK